MYLKINKDCKKEGFCFIKNGNRGGSLIYTDKHGTKFVYVFPIEVDFFKHIVKEKK